jgi:hypothetical protein
MYSNRVRQTLSTNIKEIMSQKTRLKLRIVAIIMMILAIAMQLQFIIIPSLSDYTFWIAVSSCILLLIANR